MFLYLQNYLIISFKYMSQTKHMSLGQGYTWRSNVRKWYIMTLYSKPFDDLSNTITKQGGIKIICDTQKTLVMLSIVWLQLLLKCEQFVLSCSTCRGEASTADTCTGSQRCTTASTTSQISANISQIGTAGTTTKATGA